MNIIEAVKAAERGETVLWRDAWVLSVSGKTDVSVIHRETSVGRPLTSGMVTSDDYVVRVEEYDFTEAIGLLERGERIKSLVTGDRYSAARPPSHGPAFYLSEIKGKWVKA